jgi:hypothetical protein
MRFPTLRATLMSVNRKVTVPVGKDAARPGLPKASLVPDIWAFASSAVMMLPRMARKGGARGGRNLLAI